MVGGGVWKMLLKEIRPRYFGPFWDNAVIDIEDNLTILTGSNDVGKSAVIRLLAKAFANKHAGEVTESDVNVEYLHQLNKPWNEDSSIGCSMLFSGNERTHEILNTKDFDNAKIQTLCRFSKGKPFHFVTDIHTGNRGVVSLNKHIPPPIHSVLISQDSNAISDVVDLYKMSSCESDLMKLAFGKNLEVSSLNSLSEGAYVNLLISVSSRLNEKLHKLLPSTGKLQFRLVNSSAKSRNHIHLQLIDTHGGLVPVSYRGTGMRRLVSIMATLMTELSSNRQYIILSDEPEASLHADAQHAVRRMFETISRNSNVQVIYSTHSPSMINPMEPQSVRVLKRQSETGRAVTIIDNKPYVDNFKTVRASLGMTASDSLLYAPITIVTEGRTEVSCLPHLLFKLFSDKISGFEFVDVLLSNCHFLDGMGDSFEYICRIAASQGTHPILFVDGDKSRKVKQLINAGKLHNVPIVQLKDSTEFEELVPTNRYFQALASDMDHPHSSDDLNRDYTEFIKNHSTDLSKYMFSKKISLWLGECHVEYRYEKPRVMKKTINITPSKEINTSDLRVLVNYITNAVV